jgi:hypothetical protein
MAGRQYRDAPVATKHAPRPLGSFWCRQHRQREIAWWCPEEPCPQENPHTALPDSGRKQRPGIAVTVRIPTDIRERLERLAAESHVDLSTVLREAAEMILVEHERKR